MWRAPAWMRVFVIETRRTCVGAPLRSELSPRVSSQGPSVGFLGIFSVCVTDESGPGLRFTRQARMSPGARVHRALQTHGQCELDSSFTETRCRLTSQVQLYSYL